MFGRQTVEFSVKGPVSLILDEEQVALPGCSILDINFNRPSQVSICNQIQTPTQSEWNIPKYSVYLIIYVIVLKLFE